MKNKKYILGALLIVIVVGGLWVAVRGKGSGSSSQSIAERALVQPASFNPSIWPKFSKTVSEVQELVKKDPKNVDLWMRLGVYYKMADDYEGARLAWEQAMSLTPTMPLAYLNMADLYEHFIRDNVKAEANWKKAIELDPHLIAAYSGLAEQYSTTYKEKYGQVPAVLQQGLKENPHSIDLLLNLARYYKDTKDSAHAKEFYTKAMTEAKALARKDIIENIKIETNGL